MDWSHFIFGVTINVAAALVVKGIEYLLPKATQSIASPHLVSFAKRTIVVLQGTILGCGGGFIASGLFRKQVEQHPPYPLNVDTILEALRWTFLSGIEPAGHVVFLLGAVVGGSIGVFRPDLVQRAFRSPITARDEAAHLLVSRWMPATDKEYGSPTITKYETLEFTKDNSVTYTSRSSTCVTYDAYEAKYKMVDEQTLEVTWTEETLQKYKRLHKGATRVQLAVSNDELVFSVSPWPGHSTEKWKRVPLGEGNSLGADHGTTTNNAMPFDRSPAT